MRKNSTSHKKTRFRKLKKAPPGSAPGMISVSEGALKPIIEVISYNETEINTNNFNSGDEIKNYILSNNNLCHWIEIKGFGDTIFFENLSNTFNLHRLELEDVLSGHQRPKLEEAEDHQFITSRAISFSSDDEIQDDQVAIFLFSNFVITIQEAHTEYFIPLKDRLQHNRGIFRNSGASYLAYALMDSVVDNYFPFMEKLGNYLDDLEDSLLHSPDQYSLQNIQATKRRLILFRRIAWSEREKLNDILRTPSPLFSDVARRYLRDTYDHTIQIMDIIDSYREITASLMDIYLSSVSNKLNQVMKFLTIISTIFIPLTFIAGIYGMNFVYHDEVTGKTMPLNIPELYSPYGYVGVLLLMFVMVIVMVIYFVRKGWFGWKE